MTIRGRSLSMFLCLCLGLAAVPAQAEWFYTTRSGAECVETQDTTPEIYYNLDGAYNDSTLDTVFICPVDNNFLETDRKYYFDKAHWIAYVDDNNRSRDVKCALQSCEGSGTCRISASSKSTGIGNSQILYIDPNRDLFDLGAFDRALLLRCVIPGKVGASRSGIRKYTVYTTH